VADTDIPQFRTYAEGEPISRVDPRDFQPPWKLKPPWGPGNDDRSACSPGADTAAVYRRWCLLTTLTTYNLLTPWKHVDATARRTQVSTSDMPGTRFKIWKSGELFVPVSIAPELVIDARGIGSEWAHSHPSATMGSPFAARGAGI